MEVTLLNEGGDGESQDIRSSINGRHDSAGKSSGSSGSSAVRIYVDSEF
jgi:hypothetical protein